MVTPQKVFPPRTKPGQEEENSGLITPNASYQQNMYKSTCDSYNEDIVNITSSDNNESENDDKSILSSTSYSAGMHTSGDNTDGQDIPDLITDTEEDNNTTTMDSQKYWGFLSAPMGVAVRRCWLAQQNSNHNQNMEETAVKLMELSETDMDSDHSPHPRPQYIG